MHFLCIFLFFFQKLANMEWYFVFLIVLLAVLFILFLPLCFQLRIYLNALQNLGAISISLFGIFTLASFQIQLKKDAVKILKHKKKNNEKEMKYFDASSIFISLLMKNLFHSIKIKELSLFFSIGQKNDAFHTAYFSGLWQAIIHSCLQILKTVKGNFESNVGTESDNDENKLKFAGYLNLLIFPIQILYCLILSLKQFLKIRSRYERLKSSKIHS